MTDALRIAETAGLALEDRDRLRRLLDAAFDGDFSDDDWAHALGGWHAIVERGGDVVAHGSIVPRRIEIAGTAFAAAYVEAVAVAPALQRTGLGTAVMRALNDVIRDRFELGVLSSGEWSFYERVGWERWRGPTWVRAESGELVRTPDDDDGVMVLRCAPSREIDPAAPIVCEARPGDAW